MLYGSNSISKEKENKQELPTKHGINPETDNAVPKSLLGIYIEEKRNRPAELTNTISKVKSSFKKTQGQVEVDLDYQPAKKESEAKGTEVDTPEIEKIYSPFQEKHLIESLSVQAADTSMQVMFYNMLNQGKKRGKETQILSLDCERILTKKGERLARVSIINFYGNVVFDTLVKPWAKVTDYREWITGIKAIDLKHAPSYPKIAPLLKKILNDKVVVGHSIVDDFKHLKLNADEFQCEIRDISTFTYFQRIKSSDGKVSNSSPVMDKNASPQADLIAGDYTEKRRLKELSSDFLNADIQSGHHSSIIDARCALALYRRFQTEIEADIACTATPGSNTIGSGNLAKDLLSLNKANSSPSVMSNYQPNKVYSLRPNFKLSSKSYNDFDPQFSSFSKPFSNLVEIDKNFVTASIGQEMKFSDVDEKYESKAAPPKYMTELNEFTDMHAVLIPDLISVTDKFSNFNCWN